MAKSGVKVAVVGDLQPESRVLAGIPAEWFCVVRDGLVLQTPGGRPLAHPKRPLIEAVAREGTSKKGLQLDSLTLYSMLCTMQDSGGRMKWGSTCRHLLLGDPSLQTGAGPEAADQLAHLRPLDEYFERNKLPRLSLGQGVSAEAQEETFRQLGLGQELDRVVAFFDGQLGEMSAGQYCVVTNCVHVHNVFVLGVLLAQSACNPEQSERATRNGPRRGRWRMQSSC
jgi:hypothetical protein